MCCFYHLLSLIPFSAITSIARPLELKANDIRLLHAVMTTRCTWSDFLQDAPPEWTRREFVQNREPRFLRSRYGQNVELKFKRAGDGPTASEQSVKSLLNWGRMEHVSLALATQIK